jgi:putative phosphoribosyl transferase
MMFEDRYDAAEQLVRKLQAYKDNKDVVIIAIPRGALEIGSVLAKELNAPLDVIFVKKIGSLEDPELAVGTVSMTQQVIEPFYKKEHKEYIEQQIKEIRAKLSERSNKYRGNKAPLDLKGKIVILTDDGIATGHTLQLAIELIKKENPKKLIVAVPVGPPEVISELRKDVDELICLEQPEFLLAIGAFYKRFPQVEDEQAIELLTKARRP